MNQSIDFLKSLPRPRVIITLNLLALIILIVLSLFFALTLMQTIKKKSLQNELSQVVNQRNTAEITYQQLAKKYPLLAADTPLALKIEQLEKQVIQRKKKFEELTHETYRKPFSSYLKVLSEIIPEDVWITRFYINQDNNSITIKGNALSAISVTVFLRRIQNINIYRENDFDLFDLQKDPKKSYVTFEIANESLLSTIDKQKAEKDKTKPNETEVEKK